MRRFLSSVELTGSRYVCPSCSRHALPSITSTTSQRSTWSRRKQQRVYSTATAAFADTPELSLFYTLDRKAQIPLVTHRPTTTAPDDGQDFDPTAKILTERQPERLLHILLRERSFGGALRDMSPVEFQSVLIALSPDYFITDIVKLQRDFFHEASLPKRHLETLPSLFSKFKANVQSIFAQRVRSGHTLGLPEYTYLLDCARAMGDVKMASQVWDEMRHVGVMPDTKCYNHMMEARCWESAYVQEERFKLRNTPWNYINRRASSYQRIPGYRGVSTGAIGTKGNVMALFDSMAANGVLPDGQTFINLLYASGRDADMNGVRTVLRHVWNITDNVPDGSDPDESLGTAQKPRDTVVEATGDLLYAIAHVFGTNNDLPSALRLIDSISTTHDIKVPQRVWAHLLEWSYVLSMDRYGKWKKENSNGSLPRQSMLQLWQIMSSEPYNVKADMPMLNYLAYVQYEKSSIMKFLEIMRQGREHFEDSRRATSRAMADYKDIDAAVASSMSIHSTPPPAAWYKARRNLVTQRLIYERNKGFMRRWVKLLTSGARWNLQSGTFLWEREKIQNCLVEWQEFLPYSVRYRTKNFEIQFDDGALHLDQGVLAQQFPGISEDGRFPSLGKVKKQ